jgi:hypothetical protein
MMGEVAFAEVGVLHSTQAGVWRDYNIARYRLQRLVDRIEES